MITSLSLLMRKFTRGWDKSGHFVHVMNVMVFVSDIFPEKKKGYPLGNGQRWFVEGDWNADVWISWSCWRLIFPVDKWHWMQLICRLDITHTPTTTPSVYLSTGRQCVWRFSIFFHGKNLTFLRRVECRSMSWKMTRKRRRMFLKSSKGKFFVKSCHCAFRIITISYFSFLVSFCSKCLTFLF